MEQFKQLKSLGILFGIIMVVLGAVLLLFADKVVEAVAMIVAIALLIFGAFKCITVLTKWKNIDYGVLKMIPGLLLLVIGIYVLINTKVTITVVGVIIGVFAILSAVDRFSTAWERKKSGMKNGSAILFGFIHLLFGVGMIYASFALFSLIVTLAGVYLLMSGIMVLLSTCYFLDF